MFKFSQQSLLSNHSLNSFIFTRQAINNIQNITQSEGDLTFINYYFTEIINQIVDDEMKVN